jgi:hypothetical protein
VNRGRELSILTDIAFQIIAQLLCVQRLNASTLEQAHNIQRRSEKPLCIDDDCPEINQTSMDQEAKCNQTRKSLAAASQDLLVRNGTPGAQSIHSQLFRNCERLI